MSGRHSISNFLKSLLRPSAKEVCYPISDDAFVCSSLPELQIPESGIKGVVNGVLEQAKELERRVGIAEADSKRLQALSKRISDAFICVSNSGEVIDFNKAFSSMFEVTLAEVRETSEGLVRVASLLETLKEAASGNYLLSNRLSMETSPGVTKLLEVARVAVENSNGQEQVFILRDLTSEQEWSDRLIKSERTLSAVSEASQIISELPLEVAVPKVTSLLSESFGAEHSLLIHIDNKESAIVLGGSSPSDNLISELVMQTSEPNGISKMRRRQDFLTRVFEDRQVYSFPLRVNNKFWGVFAVLSKKNSPINLNDLSINAILTFMEVVEGVLEKDLLGRAWDTSEKIRKALLDLLPIPAYIRDSKSGGVESNSAFQKLAGSLESFDWPELQNTGLLVREGSLDSAGRFKHASIQSGPYSIVLGTYLEPSINLGALEEISHLISTVDSLKETTRILSSLSQALGIHSTWAYTVHPMGRQRRLKVLGSVAKAKPLTKPELQKAMSEAELLGGKKVVIQKDSSNYVLVPVFTGTKLGAALLLHSEGNPGWMEKENIAIDLVVLALQRDLGNLRENI